MDGLLTSLLGFVVIKKEEEYHHIQDIIAIGKSCYAIILDDGRALEWETKLERPSFTGSDKLRVRIGEKVFSFIYDGGYKGHGTHIAPTYPHEDGGTRYPIKWVPQNKLFDILL